MHCTYYVSTRYVYAFENILVIECCVQNKPLIVVFDCRQQPTICCKIFNQFLALIFL